MNPSQLPPLYQLLGVKRAAFLNPRQLKAHRFVMDPSEELGGPSQTHDIFEGTEQIQQLVISRAIPTFSLNMCSAG